MTRTAHPFEVTAPVIYAQSNLGRADDVDLVIRSMVNLDHDLRDLCRRVVLQLIEIDEGDKTRPSDHELVRRHFTEWDIAHFKTREPTLLYGLDRPLLRSVKSFPAAPGVKHWSPPRRVNRTRHKNTAGPDTSVLGGHYQAGVHNGDRPADAKRELTLGYRKMEAVEDQVTDDELAKGNHVVKMFDRNWRHYRPRHRREKILRYDGPDVISVIPAIGWEFDELRDGKVDTYIEPNHDGLWVRGQFRRVHTA